MSLFFTDDYPDWVEEMASYWGVDTKVTDQDIWELARQHEEVPHIGNIVVRELLSAIIIKIRESSKCKDMKIELYVNAMCSSLSVDGTDYTDGETLKKYLNNEE